MAAAWIVLPSGSSAVKMGPNGGIGGNGLVSLKGGESTEAPGTHSTEKECVFASRVGWVFLTAVQEVHVQSLKDTA